MLNIRYLLSQDMVAMTVYSPDAVISNACKKIDNYILKHARLTLLTRFKFHHSKESIAKFYNNSFTVNSPSINELVTKLFTRSYSIVSLWQGDHPSNILNTIKGTSHPAFAKHSSIRSYFGCDNSVCNLIHVSDNCEEILYELSAVNSSSLLDANEKDLKIQTLRDSLHSHPAYTNRSYSGLVQLLAIIDPNYNSQLIYTMPSIKQHMTITHYLDYMTKEKRIDTIFMELWDCYKNSDIEELDNILIFICKEHNIEVGNYTRFILQCGSLSYKKWDYIQ